MIDKEKAKAAIASMCENPEWKKVIENAPGAANLRIALAFYASKNLSEMTQQEKDEYREFREMLERQLNAEELKYLAEEFGRMGVEAASSHYNELFAKKSPEEQQQGQKAYDDLMAKIRAANNGGDGASGEGAEGSEEDDVEEQSDEGGEATEDEAPTAPNPAPAEKSAANATPVPQQEELPFSVPQELKDKNAADAKRIVAAGAKLFSRGFKFKKRGASAATAQPAQTQKKPEEAKE